MSFIEQKFKTNLHHTGIKSGQHICVALSGGSSSSSALQMLYKSMTGTHRRWLFNITVIHINTLSLEQSWTPHVTSEYMNDKLVAMESKMKEYGFNFVNIPLESVYCEEGEEVTNEHHKSKLISLFDTLSSIDDKEDMVRFLR